ncbi:hypothetical protein KL942_000582 [Ogataea angusta]|uniref:Vacuolar membrane protease n=1 Tax=Pichia angusta TaxID=870730 RepID=A0ABQ7S308_PICAN|nr:hypothetical protein KL942_000582 [Ogataea angusta]KAG7852360.1 hypothetical protein KL940_000061 [Ogataea angusta]
MTEPFPNPALSGQSIAQDDYLGHLLSSNNSRSNSRKASLAYGSINDNEPVLRRSRSLTESITNSMIVATNVTWEQIQRRRFLSVCVFGCLFIFLFNLVFLPRTSLDRDLRRLHGEFLTFDDCSRLFLTQLNFKNNVRSYMEFMERDVYLPGKNHEAVESFFKKNYQFRTYSDKYETWMGRPLKTHLKMYDGDAVVYEAKLKESELLSFHPYSANGTVNSEFVYLNYGLEHDYETVRNAGVEVGGLIGIVRRGGISVDRKIEIAQEHGVSAVLVYSDPYDDGQQRVKNGRKPFPSGPARKPSSVDKETVSFLAEQPGDPTTPGWSSTLFAHRVEPKTVPKIPSLPLSYEDIEPILKTLGGPDVGWRGDLDFSYSCGPSSYSLDLLNIVEYKIKPIYNIVNEIPGVIKDEELIIGASRDSIGGLGGVSGGHVAMMELARGFDELVKLGWKPLRTIKLISWDGSSYGLLGSTEFGEFYSNKLAKNNILYINLDKINGSQVKIQSHPLFNELLQKVMKQVMVNDRQTLHQYFATSNSSMGLISTGMGDYSVFQNHLGIPSLNLGFSNNKNTDPVPYFNSLADSLEWYTSLDPDLKFPSVMAQFAGLFVLHLSEKEILHVRTHDYIATIYSRYRHIVDKVPSYWLDRICEDESNTRLETKLKEMDTLFQTLLKKSSSFDSNLELLQKQILQDYPWFRLLTKIKIAIKIKVANLKVRSLDRMFVTDPVLKDRAWIRHLIFAPSRDSQHVCVLAGLAEPLKAANYDTFAANLNVVGDALTKLYRKL